MRYEDQDRPVNGIRDAAAETVSADSSLTLVTDAAGGPGLTPEDPMVAAAVKTMRFHFEKMKENEAGTRTGEDPEHLHDMRVATRRLRAALRVFGEFLDPEAVAAHRKEVRRIGRALGPVRDLDVFLERTEAFRDSLPFADRAGLDGLLSAVEAERAIARETMIARLDGRRYQRFVKSFDKWLTKTGTAAPDGSGSGEQPVPFRVRQVLPVIVAARVADIRAHEEWITRSEQSIDRLHRLRISLKRLRYTLEFFREVLAPDVDALIEELKGEQDHLGRLHDSVVAGRLLVRYLSGGSLQPVATADVPLVAPAVADYLASTHREARRYLDYFPDLWDRVSSAGFRQAMFASTEAL